MQNNLKALSQTDDELRVGNYIVLFGGSDITGEFFTPKTHFKSNYTDLGVLYVDFEHGLDAEKSGNSQDNVLGLVDWKSAKTDEKGIFVERVLNRRAEYIAFLADLIEAGVVGTSSEAIHGLARRKASGEIVNWPLMRDSLTVTPMEPRMLVGNVLTAAKALAGIFPNSKSLATAAGITIPRSKNPDIITSKREFEDYLRDAGFSRTAAKSLASGGWDAMQRQRDAGGDASVKELIDAAGGIAALNFPSFQE